MESVDKKNQLKQKNPHPVSKVGIPVFLWGWREIFKSYSLGVSLAFGFVQGGIRW
jgi:hypothetical protein